MICLINRKFFIINRNILWRSKKRCTSKSLIAIVRYIRNDKNNGIEIYEQNFLTENLIVLLSESLQEMLNLIYILGDGER